MSDTGARGRRFASRGMTTAVAMAVAAVAIASGQQQPPAQRAQGTVQGGVNAVLVDVVVRDKRGDPVRDLKPGEVQITEDGVPQTIGSFTPVLEHADGTPPVPALAAPSTAATPAAPAAPPLNAMPPVTALVFDRLTPEARRTAVQAAQLYIGTKIEAPGYVGVFGIDLALSPYAPFTRNTRVMMQGLDKMLQRATANLDSGAARDKAEALEKAAGAASAATAGAEASAGAGGANVGTGAGDAQLAQMQANIIRDYDRMDRGQAGFATTNGLFAIIAQMRQLPGRKSIVFFSEGLALPPEVQRQFEGVKAAANRANVSIYTMDAAGLRTESEQQKIGKQVNSMGAGGGGILGGGQVGGGALSRTLENNEDVLRQDPRNGLSGLAKDTGGIAFDNTNNLRQGFDRIESDLRNYYLIGYSPTNDKYDGAFRTIAVKVSRPGVTVAARKGYYALRDTGVAAVSDWEASALGALESKSVPNAFPFRAAALLFPERDRLGLVPVVVDLRTAPLSFPASPDGKAYAADFAVLVRFLDSQNQVVRKVSQHYDVGGPIAEVERAKQGEVLFYRAIELPPGVYTMEAIVYDNPSGKASVRFSTVEVPKTDAAAFRMSSLVIAARAEKLPAKDRPKDHPFLVDDVLISPNVGEPVSRKAKEVAFFFTVYPAGGTAPEAVLDLMTNGKSIGEIPLPLASPDATGRIRQTGRLPIDQLAPGIYELRVAVKQGTTQLARTALLRITE